MYNICYQLGGILELYCPNWNWAGDGRCDDLTNVIECNYDGGDCCDSDVYTVDTLFCMECLCYSSTITPLLCNKNMEWIGDGYCDDATNNEGMVFCYLSHSSHSNHKGIGSNIKKWQKIG